MKTQFQHDQDQELGAMLKYLLDSVELLLQILCECKDMEFIKHCVNIHIANLLLLLQSKCVHDGTFQSFRIHKETEVVLNSEDLVHHVIGFMPNPVSLLLTSKTFCKAASREIWSHCQILTNRNSQVVFRLPRSNHAQGFPIGYLWDMDSIKLIKHLDVLGAKVRLPVFTKEALVRHAASGSLKKLHFHQLRSLGSSFQSDVRGEECQYHQKLAVELLQSNTEIESVAISFNQGILLGFEGMSSLKDLKVRFHESECQKASLEDVVIQEEVDSQSLDENIVCTLLRRRVLYEINSLPKSLESLGLISDSVSFWDHEENRSQRVRLLLPKLHLPQLRALTIKSFLCEDIQCFMESLRNLEFLSLTNVEFPRIAPGQELNHELLPKNLCELRLSFNTGYEHIRIKELRVIPLLFPASSPRYTYKNMKILRIINYSRECASALKCVPNLEELIIVGPISGVRYFPLFSRLVYLELPNLEYSYESKLFEAIKLKVPVLKKMILKSGSFMLDFEKKANSLLQRIWTD